MKILTIYGRVKELIKGWVREPLVINLSQQIRSKLNTACLNNDFNEFLQAVEVKNDRWDIKKLKEDVLGSCTEEKIAGLNDRLSTSKSPLSLLFTQDPSFLCAFALLTNEDKSQISGASRVSFTMCNPLCEMLLTQAAHLGYMPAMSILASNYTNRSDSYSASFWQKMGVSQVNPTSLLQRGLELLLKGNIDGDQQSISHGSQFLVLSYALGEDLAKETLEQMFDDDDYINKIQRSSICRPEVIFETIREAEGDDIAQINDRVRKWQNVIRSGNVNLKTVLKIVLEINEVIVSEKVSVSELRYLFGLRNVCSDIIVKSGEESALLSFRKAELAWRFRMVNGCSPILALLDPIQLV